MRGETLRPRAAGAAALLLASAFEARTPDPAPRPLAIGDAVTAAGFHIQGRRDISPGGDRVAYTVCDPKRLKTGPDDKYAVFATKGSPYMSMGCDIWISATEGGQQRNLTRAKGNNWSPSWSPDGSLLAFFSDRGGRPQLWVWNVRSDSVRLLSPARTRSMMGFETARWTPDGRSITVRLHPPGMEEEEFEQGTGTPPPPGESEAKEPGSTVVLLRSRRPAPPDPAATSAAAREQAPLPPGNYNLADLGLIDVASGKSRTLASKVRFGVHWLSPDGSRVAYFDMTGRRGAASIQNLFDLVVVDLATGKAATLVESVNQGFGTSLSWSPDGKWLAYFVGGETEKGSCWVVPSAGGAARKLEGAGEVFEADYLPPLWDRDSRAVFAVGGDRVWRGDVAAGKLAPLTPDLGRKVIEVLQTASGNEAWFPDGKSIVILRRDDETKKSLYVGVNAATGELATLFSADKSLGRVFDTASVSPDRRRVVFSAQSGKEPENLWIADAGFRAPRRLSSINPQLDGYTFGETRLIEFTNDDGKKLHAALLLPAGYEPGRRYPTVVIVYPQDWGSESVNAFGLGGYPALNMQMLATRGYAVLQPDVPTGKGTIMQDLMKSVMPAIDRAVALGFTDPDRLAVTGQSAGGYATLALVTQTTRFKAAIMNAGFGDLTAFYGAMSPMTGDGIWVPWLETLTGGMGQGPWDAPHAFMQNSPIYFLNRIQTPMVIQAGANDLGIVPYSDQVFAGMKRLGKDVTYLRYGGEGHVLAVQANLADYWSRVLRFLDEKLGNGAAETPR